MIVCFTIAGVRHCFQVPILEKPIYFWKGPGPAIMTNFCKTVYWLVQCRERPVTSLTVGSGRRSSTESPQALRPCNNVREKAFPSRRSERLGQMRALG